MRSAASGRCTTWCFYNGILRMIMGFSASYHFVQAHKYKCTKKWQGRTINDHAAECAYNIHTVTNSRRKPPRGHPSSCCKVPTYIHTYIHIHQQEDTKGTPSIIMLQGAHTYTYKHIYIQTYVHTLTGGHQGHAIYHHVAECS
jgi:hypothetical protein